MTLNYINKWPAEPSRMASSSRRSPTDFQKYLDFVLKKERNVQKKDNVTHSRQRRTILLKAFLFAKLLLKEALFIAKKVTLAFG